MKSGLSHLPSRKQRELAFVVGRLREEFAAKAPEFGGGRLLQILLYGSYARGDHVDDVVGDNHSDFDILLLVDREELTDMVDLWLDVEDQLLGDYLAGEFLRAPVSLIAHTLDDVNGLLARGRAFFLDVVRDGVVLFSEPGVELVAPGQIAPDMARLEAEHYRRAGLETAEAFLRGSDFYRACGRSNEAAYALHQAAESLYSTLVLALTLYSPKLHNLSRLRRRAEELEPGLATIWDEGGKPARRAYERLKEAYVKARHSRAYSISDAELDWLTARLATLKDRVAVSTLRALTP